eukprot:14951258-Ditylum_brightwellii.AAC.1
MRFYDMVRREVTVLNTVYKTIIKSFLDQWKGLTNCKKHTQPAVPKITTELPVMHWTDVFDNFLLRKFSVRTIPLSYVTRVTALAMRPVSVHKTDLPQGEAYVLIEKELVAQASHTHTLYCEDNAAVYFCLKESVRGTQYASILKPCQQAKNGRGALASIKQQFAGTDKWQAELSQRDKFLHSTEWKGKAFCPLKRFIGQHRGAHITMKEATEHVPFQLSNKFTRVGFLLTAIKCSDAGLHAVMANIKSDANTISVTSKRHHFELAATYFLPFCPILRKFPSGTKCDAIKISDTTALEFETKPSAGTSGVSLMYHTTEEYKSLTQPLKVKLQEWHNKSKQGQQKKAQGHGKGQGGSGKSPSKQESYRQGRAIAAYVYKNMQSIIKKKGEEGEAKYPKALIMSLFEDEDMKKAIRASLSAAEVIDVVSPARETVNQAINTPSVAAKRQ